MRKVKWISLMAVAGLMLLATTVPAAREEGAGKAGRNDGGKGGPRRKDRGPGGDRRDKTERVLDRRVVPSEPARGVASPNSKCPRNKDSWFMRSCPKGPRPRPGVQPMDVLLKVNGKPIGSITELVTAVEESKGKELTIDALRKGKPQTIKVVPEKRPADLQARHPAASEQPELQRMYEWFERMHPGWGGKPPMRLRFFHPGVMLPADAPMHPALPDGMSISILKQGSEPTKITVKKEDKTWEVTEKELDKLPAEVRPFVDRMLEGNGDWARRCGAARFDFVPDWTTPGKPEPSAKTDEGFRNRLEDRLEKMNQRMEQLQKALENLREKAEPEQEK